MAGVADHHVDRVRPVEGLVGAVVHEHVGLPQLVRRDADVADAAVLGPVPEVLALKHESRILGQRSNPVYGSLKSQVGSPWAKQRQA